MKPKPETPQNIDDYIAGFPEEIQQLLEKIRMTIREAAPEASEAIRYGIPTFILKGNLVSFAAYKKHIGLYPAPTGSDQFNQELSVYKAEKSTVRFPYDKPIPYGLITNMVRLRIKDNLERAEAKEKKKVAELRTA